MNKFHSYEWWKNHSRTLDWVRFRHELMGVGTSTIYLVIQLQKDGLLVGGGLTSHLKIPYHSIREVYEIRHEDGTRWFPTDEYNKKEGEKNTGK